MVEYIHVVLVSWISELCVEIAVIKHLFKGSWFGTKNSNTLLGIGSKKRLSTWLDAFYVLLVASHYFVLLHLWTTMWQGDMQWRFFICIFGTVNGFLLLFFRCLKSSDENSAWLLEIQETRFFLHLFLYWRFSSVGTTNGIHTIRSRRRSMVMYPVASKRISVSIFAFLNLYLYFYSANLMLLSSHWQKAI